MKKAKIGIIIDRTLPIIKRGVKLVPIELELGLYPVLILKIRPF